MRYDALNPADDAGRITFIAFSPGDAEHRYTEQVGMTARAGMGLIEGQEQTITFAGLSDMKADAAPVELNATSDAGLPVQFYFAYGPAVINSGKLMLDQIPSRAAFPIEVKVVAYQFGRGVEPRVKTAMHMTRTLRILKP